MGQYGPFQCALDKIKCVSSDISQDNTLFSITFETVVLFCCLNLEFEALGFYFTKKLSFIWSAPFSQNRWKSRLNYMYIKSVPFSQAVQLPVHFFSINTCMRKVHAQSATFDLWVCLTINGMPSATCPSFIPLNMQVPCTTKFYYTLIHAYPVKCSIPH